MKSSWSRFGPTCIAAWSAVRALWMGALVFLILRGDLAYHEPYFGMGVNREVLIVVAVMPIKLLGIVAGLRFGRAGDAVVEAVAAMSYACVALGIWTHRNGLRHFAVGLALFDLALLVIVAVGVMRSPLLPELHPAAVFASSIFIAIYGLTAFELRRTKNLFVAPAESPIGI